MTSANVTATTTATVASATTTDASKRQPLNAEDASWAYWPCFPLCPTPLRCKILTFIIVTTVNVSVNMKKLFCITWPYMKICYHY